MSLEEIHQKGYLTAKEQLQMLIDRNIPPETVRIDERRWACSWADAWFDGYLIRYVCGSGTYSGVDEKIRTRATKIKTKIDGQGNMNIITVEAKPKTNPHGGWCPISWQGQCDRCFSL